MKEEVFVGVSVGSSVGVDMCVEVGGVDAVGKNMVDVGEVTKVAVAAARVEVLVDS